MYPKGPENQGSPWTDLDRTNAARMSVTKNTQHSSGPLEACEGTNTTGLQLQGIRKATLASSVTARVSQRPKERTGCLCSRHLRERPFPDCRAQGEQVQSPPCEDKAMAACGVVHGWPAMIPQSEQRGSTE